MHKMLVAQIVYWGCLCSTGHPPDDCGGPACLLRLFVAGIIGPTDLLTDSPSEDCSRKWESIARCWGSVLHDSSVGSVLCNSDKH